MRVLILEDEPLVAMLLTDCLEALDHTVAASVETVADGLAAIERDGMDLAVLDCRLADGGHSWPVAERLAELGIPFLFSSGVGRGELPATFANRPMLPKPYSLQLLENALAELMG